MKRILPWMSLLILIPMVACNTIRGGAPTVSPIATDTLSPAQVQTQINQMLTALPTNTGAAPLVLTETPGPETATVTLPTIPFITTTPEPAMATSAPAATLPPVAVATATVAPTLAPAAPTATFPPTLPAATLTLIPGDPRSRLGPPTSTDPMDNDTKWVWPTGSDKYTSADFRNGKQYVTALTGTDGWRLANPTGEAFTNLYLEAAIQTEKCSGSDHYGLITRVPDVHEANQGYLFGVTCDGRYSLRRWNGLVGAKGEMKWLVDWKASSAIAAGSNQTNRLGMMMIGSRLLLYANGQLLTEVNDSTFSSGNFGVFVGSDVTDNLTIEINEMSYWLNPQP